MVARMAKVAMETRLVGYCRARVALLHCTNELPTHHNRSWAGVAFCFHDGVLALHMIPWASIACCFHDGYHGPALLFAFTMGTMGWRCFLLSQ